VYNSVIYPILKRMLGYINDEQLPHKYHLVALGVQVRLLISWHQDVQQCHEVYAYVAQWSTS
jgi:hypothetical protein